MKVDLTKKELVMLIMWCGAYETFDDSKSEIQRANAYLKLANKLKSFEEKNKK